jgi:hypothetical protein
MKIEGYVERISHSAIRGWAAAPKDSNQRLAVELLVGGKYVSTAWANKSRKDLKALNLGQTDFGFELAVPLGTRLDLAEMAVRVLGTDVSLPFSGNAATLYGIIDHRVGTVFGGWAWQVGKPEKRVALAVCHNGEKIWQISADLFRKDLLAAGIGDGKHLLDLAVLPKLQELNLNAVELLFDEDRSPLYVRSGTLPAA